MVNGDRVLVGTQTVGAENGIYVWNGASSAMTRSTDADSGAELNSAVVTVDEGTSAGSTYRQTAVSPTLGTTTITWAAFGTAAGAASETAAGIVELATTAETITGTDNTRAVTPAGLAGYTGFTKKYSTDIGDGSATSYTVTHNLNTRDVQIQVRKNSGDYGLVIVDAGAATVNTATIVFASAPTSNAYRVTVLA
jgi:hypothetical protein